MGARRALIAFILATVVANLVPAHAMQLEQLAATGIHEEVSTVTLYLARWVWDYTLPQALPYEVDMPSTDTIYVRVDLLVKCGDAKLENLTVRVSYGNVTLEHTGRRFIHKFLIRLNESISDTLRIEAEAYPETCKPSMVFLMLVYRSWLNETIDWPSLGANVTMTLEYQPPNPPPNYDLRVGFFLHVDPLTTSITITLPPARPLLFPLVPVKPVFELPILPYVKIALEQLKESIIEEFKEVVEDIGEEEEVIELAKALAPETLVSLSTISGAVEFWKLVEPSTVNYTYIVLANVTKVYTVRGAEYELINNFLVLRDLTETVVASFLTVIPLVYYVDRENTVEGTLYIPGLVAYNVHKVNTVIDAEIPETTNITWRNTVYSITFDVNSTSLTIGVNVNECRVSDIIVAVLQLFKACMVINDMECFWAGVPLLYARWGYIDMKKYNETTMVLEYHISDLNTTLANDMLTVAIFGPARRAELTDLVLNMTYWHYVVNAVLALSDKPRRALIYMKPIYIWSREKLSIVYDSYETSCGYINPTMPADVIMYSANVVVHVRDDKGRLVNATVYAQKGGRVVEKGVGSDVTLLLFPGNYTLVIDLGGYRIVRPIEVYRDLELTFNVTLPEPVNVTLKAPRYVVGKAKLEIEVELDRPSPANYTIPARLIVDGKWHSSVAIPVYVNQTKAKAVVELALGEGEHNITVVVDNVTATITVYVVGASLGYIIAGATIVGAIAVIVYIIRRPREIAL